MLNALLETRSIDKFVELADSGETLTVSELRQDSAIIARAAKDNDIQTVVYIGGKSKLYFTALLASLGEDTNFLPIDASTSRSRVSSLLSRAGRSLLVSDSVLLFEEASVKAVDFAVHGNFWILDFGDFPSQYRGLLVSTSGSTGDPKLILVPHQSLLEFLEASLEVIPIEKESRIAHVSQISFDLSIADFLFAIATDSMLVSSGMENCMRQPARFISKYRITNWLSVPSIIPLILEDKEADTSCLETIIFCGEQLYWDQVTDIARSCGNVRVFNAYGPTEGTIFCSVFSVPELKYCDEDTGPVPIGEPLRSYRFETKTENDCQELVIESRFLAKGYVGYDGLQPLKNARGDPDSLLSGDCVEVVDGRMFFVHRYDNQIKIKGYRVEIGDIEENLRRVGLRQPIVGFDGASITLYVRPDDAKLADEALIALRKVLPPYMVPKRFKIVSDFNRLRSGKIDRLRGLQ